MMELLWMVGPQEWKASWVICPAFVRGDRYERPVRKTRKRRVRNQPQPGLTFGCTRLILTATLRRRKREGRTKSFIVESESNPKCVGKVADCVKRRIYEAFMQSKRSQWFSRVPTNIPKVPVRSCLFTSHSH